ncbi:hypothetical protein DFJ73DRAFT_82576 [Zopfochytrium polystomum]|nr:hypothetical protein DFJ73DRAFT_82576 [Zopfochytrium polystomum]
MKTCFRNEGIPVVKLERRKDWTTLSRNVHGEGQWSCRNGAKRKSMFRFATGVLLPRRLTHRPVPQQLEQLQLQENYPQLQQPSDATPSRSSLTSTPSYLFNFRTLLSSLPTEHPPSPTASVPTSATTAPIARIPRRRIRCISLTVLIFYIPLQVVLLIVLQPRPHRPIQWPQFRDGRPHQQHQQHYRPYKPQYIQGNRSDFWKLEPPLNRFASAASYGEHSVGSVKEDHRAASSSFVYGFLVHDSETIAGIHDTIGLIWDPRDHFVVHVDAKVNSSTFGELVARYQRVGNVHILDVSFDCGWGTIELIAATREILAFARMLSPSSAVSTPLPLGPQSVNERDKRHALPSTVQGSANSWDFFILLDGTSFPLQPKAFIRNRLAALAASNRSVIFDELSGRYRTCNPLTSLLNIHICNFHRAHCAGFFDCTRFVNTPASGAASVVWKGTQWVGLTRAFADYVMEDHLASGAWLDFFAGSFGSDETYFATLAMGDDRFRALLEDDGRLVYKKWSSYGCEAYPPPRGYGDGPCYLGIEDWEAGLEKAIDRGSGGFLFARKLKASEDELKRRILKSSGLNPT